MANKTGSRKAAAAPKAPPKIVQIEIPLHSVRPYVPGSGPPMGKISLMPVKDSTAVILDKLALPKPEDCTPTTRRLLYYFITFSDMPDVKALIPCHKAHKYVDPYTVEKFEFENDKRLEEEKKKLAEEAAKLPAKRRAGRPAKVDKESRPSTSAGAALVLSGDEEPLQMDANLAGPSLSTPQKRKRGPSLVEEDETETGGEATTTRDQSDDSAVRRQLFRETAKRRYSTDHSADADDYSVSFGQQPVVRGSSGAGESSRASSLGGYSIPPPSIPTAKSKGKGKDVLSYPPSAHSTGTSTPALHPQYAQAMGLGSGGPSSMGVPDFGNAIQPASVANKMTPTPRGVESDMRTDSAVFLIPDATSLMVRTDFQFPHDHVSRVTTPTSAADMMTSWSNISGESDISVNRPTKKARTEGAASQTKEKAAPQPKEKTAKTPKEKTPKEKQSQNPKDKQSKGTKEKKSKTPQPESPLDEDVWEVKQLLDDGYRYVGLKRVHMYLVDWVGDFEPTWEPSANIEDKTLIRVYQEKKKAGTLPRVSNGTPYSNVAEAFEGGINIDDHHSVASSDHHGEDELLPVTDQATCSFPGSGKKKVTPRFKTFDSMLAHYNRAFPPA